MVQKKSKTTEVLGMIQNKSKTPVADAFAQIWPSMYEYCQKLRDSDEESDFKVNNMDPKVKLCKLEKNEIAKWSKQEKLKLGTSYRRIKTNDSDSESDKGEKIDHNAIFGSSDKDSDSDDKENSQVKSQNIDSENNIDQDVLQKIKEQKLFNALSPVSENKAASSVPMVSIPSKAFVNDGSAAKEKLLNSSSQSEAEKKSMTPSPRKRKKKRFKFKQTKGHKLKVNKNGQTSVSLRSSVSPLKKTRKHFSSISRTSLHFKSLDLVIDIKKTVPHYSKIENENDYRKIYDVLSEIEFNLRKNKGQLQRDYEEKLQKLKKEFEDKTAENNKILEIYDDLQIELQRSIRKLDVDEKIKNDMLQQKLKTHFFDHMTDLQKSADSEIKELNKINEPSLARQIIEKKVSPVSAENHFKGGKTVPKLQKTQKFPIADHLGRRTTKERFIEVGTQRAIEDVIDLLKFSDLPNTSSSGFPVESPSLSGFPTETPKLSEWPDEIPKSSGLPMKVSENHVNSNPAAISTDATFTYVSEGWKKLQTNPNLVLKKTPYSSKQDESNKFIEENEENNDFSLKISDVKSLSNNENSLDNMIRKYLDEDGHTDFRDHVEAQTSNPGNDISADEQCTRVKYPIIRAIAAAHVNNFATNSESFINVVDSSNQKEINSHGVFLPTTTTTQKVPPPPYHTQYNPLLSSVFTPTNVPPKISQPINNPTSQLKAVAITSMNIQQSGYSNNAQPPTVVMSSGSQSASSGTIGGNTSNRVIGVVFNPPNPNSALNAQNKIIPNRPPMRVVGPGTLQSASHDIRFVVTSNMGPVSNQNSTFRSQQARPISVARVAQSQQRMFVSQGRPPPARLLQARHTAAPIQPVYNNHRFEIRNTRAPRPAAPQLQKLLSSSSPNQGEHEIIDITAANTVPAGHKLYKITTSTSSNPMVPAPNITFIKDGQRFTGPSGVSRILSKSNLPPSNLARSGSPSSGLAVRPGTPPSRPATPVNFLTPAKQPFIHVPNPVEEKPDCFICGDEGVIKCCGKFFYCSNKCRTDDIQRHKDECSAQK